MPVSIHGRREDNVRRENRVSALRPVRRTAFLPTFNIGVFNAQSVNNKPASIVDWIMSSNLRLAAITYY